MQKIWLDMTQEALDAAYDQNVYAPNRQQVLDRYDVSSEQARARLGQPVRHRYGPGKKEGIDLYLANDRPDGAPAPVNIFVHGGAWRAGSASQYAFPADLLVNAGSHLVVLDFDWVQEHDGDLLPLADQVRRAIAWVGRQATQWGGDPERIYLSGHSSGAHLAAVALTTDWTEFAALPRDLIKGALLCSGMYELEPVSLSARSAYVRFNDECLEQLSPMRHLERINTSLLIAVGTLETPEFKRQAQDFAAALVAKDKPAELIVGEALNHFEIIETIANPYGLLGQALLRQMSLDN